MRSFYSQPYGFIKKLHEYKVKLLTGKKVLEFKSDSVLIEGKDGEMQEIKADTVIVSYGTTPEKDLADRICNAYPFAKVIKDCLTIGQAGDIERVGFFTACAIDL